MKRVGLPGYLTKRRYSTPQDTFFLTLLSLRRWSHLQSCLEVAGPNTSQQQSAQAYTTSGVVLHGEGGTCQSISYSIWLDSHRTEITMPSRLVGLAANPDLVHHP